jgi:hypothetical protein
MPKLTKSEQAVYDAVSKTISEIYSMEPAEKRAILARLSHPNADASFDLLTFKLKNLPMQYRTVRLTDVRSKEEQAVCLALQLFAIHQKSLTTFVHKTPLKEDLPKTYRQYSFGEALGELVLALSGNKNFGDDFERAYAKVKQKVLVITKTRNLASMTLRSLVNLLHTTFGESEKGHFDYASLAVDLYRLQFSKSKANVCYTWASGMEKMFVKEDNKEKESKKEASV